MAEPARKLPEEDRPVTRPDLHALDGGGEGDGVPRGNLRSAEENGGFYNPAGDAGEQSSGGPDNQGSSSPKALSKAEGSPSDHGGLYNADHDQGRFAGVRRFRNNAQRLRGRALSSKWLLGTAAVGSGGIILIIIILAFAIGGYKVVDFAEHIGAYQFARVTRQMSESTNALTAEKVGIDSAEGNASNGIYSQLKNKYAAAADKTNEAWSKLDKYRPNKVIDNFQGNKTMQFNYKQGRFGRQILDSVTINGQEVPVANRTLKNLIPGYKLGKNISFSRDFAPNLDEALKANDIGPITRAKVAREIRQRLGVSLTAWVVGKYSGKSEEKARAQVEQDAYDKAKGNGATDKSNLRGKLKDTANDAEQAEKDAVHDPKKIKDIVNSPNQIPQEVQQLIENDLRASSMSAIKSAVTNFVGFINPVYKIATPLCLIYDGSLVQSGPTIKNQTQQLERTGIYVQTAKSQLQDGFDTNAEAAGAINWKMSGVDNSYANVRASGAHADTSNYQSAEASPTGLYSIADVGLGDSLGGVVDSLFNSGTCDAFTNIWVAGGLGIGNLLITVATGGVAGGAEAGTEAAADAAAQSLTSRIVQKLISAKDFTKSFTKDAVKSGALIGGATLISKQIVTDNIGSSHNSLANNESYGNDAEAGTNIYANEISQQQNYGAPLSDNELGADDLNNRHQLAEAESQKSAYDRYLALSNSNSLLSHVGLALNRNLHLTSFKSFFGFVAGILNPVHSLASTLNPVLTQNAAASAKVTSVNTYFGNVQFGYTREERNLMALPSYGLLEDQRILDASTKEDEINSTFGACFDGSKDISDLLTDQIDSEGESHYIERNSAGDVTGGLCSQAHVGPHNSKYGDLVFRWRLVHNFNNTLDQLIDEQKVTQNATPLNGGSDQTDSSNGSLFWPFATKSTSQYNRVDQGWDIQDKPGAPIYAIASGTLHILNPDTDNFGNDYPTVKLDDPIGGPSDWIYYGHVHAISSLNGRHVKAGQLIAHANKVDGENGSHADPGWLEIGFARPGTDAPVGHCANRACAGEETPEGLKMKSLLLQASPPPKVLP